MKIYYRPPKVKPGKKKNKPLPEWNDSIGNLDKYKLSSSEVLKKKINCVSKNLEIAKKNLNENMNVSSNKVSTRKERPNSSNVNLEDCNKIRERSLSNKQIRKKSVEKINSGTGTAFGRSLHVKRKSLNVKFATENKSLKNQFNQEDDIYDNKDSDEIVFVKNPLNIKINSTKVEKVEKKNNCENVSNLTNLTKTNFFLDDELSEKMRILEENLVYREKKSNYKNPQIIENKNPSPQRKIFNKDNFVETRHKFQQDMEEPEGENSEKYENENSNENYIQNEENTDDITDLNDNLKIKFNNLSNIEDSMKKLNEILDYSSKSSLRFKFETDQNHIKVNDKTKDKSNKETDRELNELSKLKELNEPKPYSRINPSFSNQHSITKTVEIPRKVINIDKVYKEKEDNSEDANLDLDYLKNLLNNAKSELDKLGEKFNDQNYHNDKEEEEEIQPRQLPKFYSRK